VLAVPMGSAISFVVTSAGRAAPELRRTEDTDEAARRAAIVELARQGDAEAFGLLYDHYQASVFRVIYTQTRSTALSEDLTSETFFRALRGIQNFKLDAELFAPWLYRIARNLVIDHSKAGRTRLEQAQDMSRYDDVCAGPGDDIITLLNRERMRAALSELSTGQRRVIELRFLREQSITETAYHLDTTEGAVKQLQMRALRNLAKLLRD
jgi:RNA polymerase sigma-70 factor, ECF subfamily